MVWIPWGGKIGNLGRNSTAGKSSMVILSMKYEFCSVSLGRWDACYFILLEHNPRADWCCCFWYNVLLSHVIFFQCQGGWYDFQEVSFYDLSFVFIYIWMLWYTYLDLWSSPFKLLLACLWFVNFGPSDAWSLTLLTAFTTVRCVNCHI